VSEENVELHRHLVEAFNARDIDAFIALCDPSIEFHSTMGVGGVVYRGHPGMRTWHRDIEDVWGEIRLDDNAFFDLGDHSLVFNVMQGRGSHSGVEVAGPYAQVCKWRDGLVVSQKVYAHREDALKDLGVSEDALEPIAP
jgi:ketosteroid isomerase-like protein